MVRERGPMNDEPAESVPPIRRIAWVAVAALGVAAMASATPLVGPSGACQAGWLRCAAAAPTPGGVAAAVVGVGALLLALWMAAQALRDRALRGDRVLLWSALAAPPLLLIHAWLGHSGWLLAALSALVAAAVQSGYPAEARSVPGTGPPRWAWGLALLGYASLVFGAAQTAAGAGLVCPTLPLCGDGLAPPPTPLGLLVWLHRASGFALALALVPALFLVGRPGTPVALRWAGWSALALAFAGAGAGMAAVAWAPAPGWRLAHQALGAGSWLAVLSLVLLAAQVRPRSGAAGRRTLADYVALTKPRVISLLLLTAIAPMFVTDRGWPPLSTVLAVAVGGFLMAGGANAINMWFDRDIDGRMARTRLRPIPSGRIAPRAALLFGVGLGALAFAVLWSLANPLSAWLALGGLLFYVFVYTMWLKRSSPQNIVIGGAAGAFPPLVGYAAAAGTLDLAAVYLFAIIFYWTPPHFWALALVKRGDYARVGVPMLPVVYGERHTRVQILLYTLLLLPLTLLPSLFGAFGPLYAVAALLLGARLVWYAVRVLRETEGTAIAWRMYRYSLVYLALLFVAMSVDRRLPDRSPSPAEVLILDRPDPSAR